MGQKLKSRNRGDMGSVLEVMKEAGLPQINGNSSERVERERERERDSGTAGTSIKATEQTI